MTTSETVVVVLGAVGVAFMLISAVGLIRLPDVFARMHAASKASTVGVGCLLLAAGIYFMADNLFWRMVFLVILIFATSPIATAAMARAAYRTGSSYKRHLRYDDLAGRIDPAPATSNAVTSASGSPASGSPASSPPTAGTPTARTSTAGGVLDTTKAEL